MARTHGPSSRADQTGSNRRSLLEIHVAVFLFGFPGLFALVTLFGVFLIIPRFDLSGATVQGVCGASPRRSP